MPPLDNAGPLKPPPSFSSGPHIVLPKRASPIRSDSPSSAATLPYRPSNASLSSIFASTSTPPSSRPISPSNAAASTDRASTPAFSPGGSATLSPSGYPELTAEDPRSLITKAFAPYVTILASADSEEIAREKGFDGGLLEVLRPFGEQIHGKVTVRDSVGASKSWEDFSIRLVSQGDGLLTSRPSQNSKDSVSEGVEDSGLSTRAHIRSGGSITDVEEVVERHLSYAEMISVTQVADYLNRGSLPDVQSSTSSPFFTLYLRRLLSALPLSPHETFSHPVACIIAISSRNGSPIEMLRQLYRSSSQGEKCLPIWINNEYLRYYVLIHDEDKDDISKSTALFEQMKRHFGLHCHLLRLRSSRCVPTDDDSVRLPVSDWISAAEELAEIQKREHYDDMEDPTPCLFESDITAIRALLRELVTQSIVPFMERNIATWNDQIASRRRGISGRFMSLSKRWTGFSSGSRSNSGTTSPSSTGSAGNYDPLQGFYRPDSPEALLRKLADYAFILRDWKLANSTYDILRTDYNNDKAWRYLAGANEMAAISALLTPQTMTPKARAENVDQLLETAYYSYTTRCAAPYNALRCIAVSVELLRLRGSSAADDAAKWTMRLLESNLLGEVGHALFDERTAACYGARKGVGSGHWGSRRRKCAVWNLLAADAWLKLRKYVQAKKCLLEAERLFTAVPHKNGHLAFDKMDAFINQLQKDVQLGAAVAMGAQGKAEGPDEVEGLVEEESEKLDTRAQRRSMVAGVNPTFEALDAEALAGTDVDGAQKNLLDDSFE